MTGGKVSPTTPNEGRHKTNTGFDYQPKADDSSEGLDLYKIILPALPIAALIGIGSYVIARYFRQEAEKPAAPQDSTRTIADSLIRDQIIPWLSYGDEINSHINKKTTPSQALRDFLKGELGRAPTNSEVKEYFRVMEMISQNSRREVIHNAIFGSENEIYQIFTEENLSNLAAEIKKLAKEFKENHGRDPIIVEVAAGDGSLARRLRERGINITATDNKSFETGIIYGSDVIKLDGVKAARKADIIVASWLYKEHPGVEIAHLLAKDPSKSLVLIGTPPVKCFEGGYDGGVTDSGKFWEIIFDPLNRLTRSVPNKLGWADLLSRTDAPDGYFHYGTNPTEVSIVRTNGSENMQPATTSTNNSASPFSKQDLKTIGNEAQKLGLDTMSPEEGRALRGEASPESDVKDTVALEVRRMEETTRERSARRAMREMTIRERERSRNK